MSDVKLVLIGRFSEVNNIIQKTNEKIVDEEDMFTWEKFKNNDMVVLFRNTHIKTDNETRRASAGGRMENKNSMFNWETYNLENIGKWLKSRLEDMKPLQTGKRNRIDPVDAGIIISAYEGIFLNGYYLTTNEPIEEELSIQFLDLMNEIGNELEMDELFSQSELRELFD